MLSQQLANGLEYLARHMVLLPEPYPGCILFFTVAAENKAASVFHVRATTLEAAWREGRPACASGPGPASAMRSICASTGSRTSHPWRRTVPCPIAVPGPRCPCAPLPWPMPAWSARSCCTPCCPIRPRVGLPTHPTMSPLPRPLHPPACCCTCAACTSAVSIPPWPCREPTRRSSACGHTSCPCTPRSSSCWRNRARKGWPGCEDVCDHLGVTYALLQAQRHAGSAALAQAIALAMGHVEQRLQPLPGDCLSGALAMLVLARHLRNSFVLGPGPTARPAPAFRR